MKNKKTPLVSIEGVTEKPQIVKKKYKTTYDSITNPNAGDKECSWMDYMSDASFRLFPEKDQWRQRFIASLYEWSKNSTSLEIMQFCMEKNMPYSTFRSWQLKYADIDEAIKEVKLMIASRKRIGAIYKQFDKDMILKDLYRYDPEWVEVDKYHADLKKNETNTDRNITVVIPQMPSVDTVKAKNE